MAAKYQIQSPGGKLLAPIELDTLIQMAEAGLVNGDTLIFDLQARRMVYADELAALQGRVSPGLRAKPPAASVPPAYTPPPAVYPTAPSASGKRFEIPRAAWLIAGGIAGVVVLGLVVAQAGSRLRGIAAMATNAGTPARIWGGAVAQNPDDLQLFEQAKPRVILGGGERTRELLGEPGDTYSMKRLEVSQRVVPLPSGTQVRVLRQDGGIAEVRVSEPGVNYNLTGYVHTAKLRRISDNGPFDPNYQPMLPGL